MSTPFIIAAVIASLIAIVAMFLLFVRLRQVPALAPSTQISKTKISIVIPARNEEQNLETLLPSLIEQSLAAHEIIVVDDQSSDQTANIAAKFGCRVIRSGDLPDGWFGKPWACQQGADAAKGDVLFFLDADVCLEKDALARLAWVSDHSPQAIISICPWHRTQKAYEQLSVFFNLLMVGGIGAFTLRGPHAKGIGLFGQTMWISRSLYRTIDGHHSVKKTILENLHLARDLEQRGIERLCFIGKNCISMRMFPGGLGELISSWSKGFSSGASLTSPLAMSLSIFWMAGLMALSMITLMLPLSGGGAYAWALGSYLVVASALFFLFRKIGHFAWWNALFFPLSLFFYQGLFAHALIRKSRGGTTQWKGRHVA